MSAAFSKLGPLSVGASVDIFGPHIEELHSYFKTRGMGFGSPQDLKPFVDRLESDANFRDEVGSMMRTIIYRERDGLSWPELMELMAAAVGGPGVAEAEAPEVRTDVRRLMVFVEGIFRTRRNPGAASAPAAAPVVVLKPEREERKELETVESSVIREKMVANDAESEEAELPNPEQPAPEHPVIDRFYRARGVAEAEEIETFADQRRVEDATAFMAEDYAAQPETVLHTDLHLHIPFEDFGDQETAERGSPAWLWMAGICALLLAFCGGLFVHQRLIVPLRAPNTPYEAPPQETQKAPAAIPAAPPTAQTAEDAGFVTKGAPGVKPATAGGPVTDVTQLPRYMAPATIGASPAVMAAHLVYAPPPAYPMMAEITRTQGKVTVEAVVGKSGRVIRAQAIDGHRLLRGAAVRAVKARRYRPYLVNDRPTNVATVVTVDFKLKR